MSGHSHFSSIKHKKAIEDQKRGKIFSKFSRKISIIAKEKGGDPTKNSSLKLVIEKAKESNMPKDNIEKAIKKGTGQLEGGKLESFVFEGYGPGGIAILIEGITDNKNRALGEIRQILEKKGGKLVGEGSVRWMFEKKGVITIDTVSQQKSREELELCAIEAGAEDFKYRKKIFDVYTKPEELDNVKNKIEKDVKIYSANMEWIAREDVQKDEKTKESANALFELLDENDNVQEIYSNLGD